MATFAVPLPTKGYDGLFIEDPKISWAARNSSKPGRTDIETWVIHATPAWSKDCIEWEASEAAWHLFMAFCACLNISPPQPLALVGHRWRYARAETPLQQAVLWDEDLMIAACGDWCRASRVEDAYLSGIQAANKLQKNLEQGSCTFS